MAPILTANFIPSIVPFEIASNIFDPEDQGFDVNIGGFEKGSPMGGYYSPYKNPRLSDGPSKY